MSAEEAEEPIVYSLVIPDGTSLVGSEGYTGIGVASYENGDKYEGHFVSGQRQGQGVYTFKTGVTYKGDYIENLRQGLGKLVYTDGSYYHGYFFDGFQNGDGTMKYPNGDIYYGEWKSGTRHGRGTYIFNKSRSRLEGEWANGEVVRGVWKLEGGSYYSGSFKYSKPCGDGDWVVGGNCMSGSYSVRVSPVDFAPDSRIKPPTAVMIMWHQNRLIPAIEKN